MKSDIANDVLNVQSFVGKFNNNRWKTEFVHSDKIGKGGFASVYKARHCFDDQTYAVKEVKVRMKEGKSKTTFASDLHRVMDEAKFLAKLNHPNVLRYYNSWLEGTTKQKKSQAVSHQALNKEKKFRKGTKEFGGVGSTASKTVKAEENHNRNAGNFDNDDCDLFSFERSNNDNTNTTQDTKSPNLSLKAFSFPDFSEDYLLGKESNVQAPQRRPLNCKTNQRSAVKGKASPSPDSKTNVIGSPNFETIVLYIQTELCNGTLEDYLNKRNEKLQLLKRRSSEEFAKANKEYLKDALSFAKQILQGISYIHSFGIVHRDLKPSNIFVQDKTCKIGDFGLVKKLDAIDTLASSPILSRSAIPLKKGAPDFKLKAAAVLNFDSSEEELPTVSFQKTVSNPLIQEDDSEFYMEFESPITKSVGTKIYASPEQWQADKGNFDQRADIFSLGLIFLLLFHPMSTYMEKDHVLKESKQGKISPELEKELPEIVSIIKRMLSVNPSERPSIDSIFEHLKLPLEINADLSGNLLYKKENSPIWREKYFKFIEGTLYVFNQKEDKKAESVYNVSQWKTLLGRMRSPIKTSNFEAESEGKIESCRDAGAVLDENICISFENPLQLGCWIKAENPQQTLTLFKYCSELGESY